MNVAPQEMTARRKSIPSFYLLLFMLFIMHRACAPPDIGDITHEQIPSITVDSIYNDVRAYTDVPVKISCYLRSSFHLNPIGGFYFIEDLESGRSMLAFSKQIPPEEAEVVIVGLVKPLIYNKQCKLLYLKEKALYEVSPSLVSE